MDIKDQIAPAIDIYSISHFVCGIIWAWFLLGFLKIPIDPGFWILFGSILIFEPIEKIYIEPYMDSWIPEGGDNQFMDVVISFFGATVYLWWIGIRPFPILLDALNIAI